MFVNIRRRYCRTGWAKKLSPKRLFISSPNSDGLCMQIYISHGSVATQLKCGGMLSNNFVTNFPQNLSVKKFENRSIFVENMNKNLLLTFWATL